jgi:protein-tyrosine phosphatase
VFRHGTQAAGLGDKILIDSAGTHGYHIGEAPDPRTIAAARARGYDLTDLRARKLTADDFHKFDLLLAMDKGHHDIMKGLAPANARGRVAMFLDFAPGRAGQDVPDPYYGGARDFEHVLDLAQAGAEGLLVHIRREKGW